MAVSTDLEGTERTKNWSDIAQFIQEAGIYGLAVELLALIFELTMTDETHVADVHRVSQVCTQWRRIAHGTPRLWIRPLRVNLYSASNAKGDNAAVCLRAWLARSAPLCVRVSFKQALPGTIHRGVMEAALAAAPRLRAVQLQTMPTTPAWLVKRLAQCALDSLEELDLGMVAADLTAEAEADAEPTPFAVPALRTLHMINLGTLQISVPWPQLTELTFECDSLDIIFEVLRQGAPHLVTASIAVLGESELSPEHCVPVHFGHLRTLSLRFRADLSPFLDHLTAPLLTTLRLTLHLAHWDCEPLAACSPPASCPGCTTWPCTTEPCPAVTFWQT
ncbi:F-box domain-containing protein [Mycena sanguinolenta]|uniref:F-box domain-containing protein n=1 Tax=Mycena sanguinolenta TaxID=230812 RepID=A0A8H6ZEB3_9AGAR|nr:F-box domain-containing protein [Mycena sanguinolenta]